MASISSPAPAPRSGQSSAREAAEEKVRRSLGPVVADAVAYHTVLRMSQRCYWGEQNETGEALPPLTYSEEKGRARDLHNLYRAFVDYYRKLLSRPSAAAELGCFDDNTLDEVIDTEMDVRLLADKYYAFLTSGGRTFKGQPPPNMTGQQHIMSAFYRYGTLCHMEMALGTACHNKERPGVLRSLRFHSLANIESHSPDYCRLNELPFECIIGPIMELVCNVFTQSDLFAVACIQKFAKDVTERYIHNPAAAPEDWECCHAVNVATILLPPELASVIEVRADMFERPHRPVNPNMGSRPPQPIFDELVYPLDYLIDMVESRDAESARKAKPAKQEKGAETRGLASS